MHDKNKNTTDNERKIRNGSLYSLWVVRQFDFLTQRRKERKEHKD
jgi:hypothetical protein